MNPEDIAAASVNFTGMSPEQLRAATVYLLEQIRIGGGMGPGPYVEISGDTMTGPLSFSGTTNSGLRLNNLTTAQRNALAGPAAGMLVWDTTQTRLSVYDGSGWTDGFVRLAGDTMTGDLSVPDVTITANGALSDPALSVTGTPITGGTATTTKPLVLIETTGATSTAWSTSGTMLGVNAPNAFAGNLLDAQLNGASKFSVTTTQMLAPDGTAAAPGISWVGDPDTGMYKEAGNRIAWSFSGVLKMYFDGSRIQNQSGSASSPSYSFSSNTGDGFYLITSGTRTGFSINGARVASFASDALELGASGDAILVRDGAANTLALRNSTSAQTFRVYNTYTDGSNYRRISATWNSTTGLVMVEGSGTGTDGSIAFNDSALATNATVGFVMIPSCAGAPSGVPSNIPTGQVPMVYDSTNNRIYAYNGSWRSVAVA